MVHRRRLLALGISALSAPAFIRTAAAENGSRIQAAVDRFAALPGATSALVIVDNPAAPLRAAHDPQARLFVGSAVKTFILAQVLRDVEAGRLSEDAQVTIDDKVRSLVSPVFLHLTGTTTLRSALEAMIAHSDNTGTDVALAAATPTGVRALIADAGLRNTQIPESTRRLFSYLAGAPDGVDLDWSEMERIASAASIPNSRSPLNDRATMASTADDLVHWYQQALRGAFFKRPETLVEFKRIQAMADAIARVVPADTVAFAKGGSIDWENFHCLCFAGQMIVSKVPVTFCMTLNWTGPADGVPAATQSYGAAVAGVLQEASAAVG
jgi:beta-lactamase class A